MTIVARHGCWNVHSRLALHDAVVMALRTASRSHTVVGKESWFPIRCAMTTITIHRGRQVIRRLKRRDHTTTGRVALHTLGWSAAKHTLDMAAFAGDLRVASGKLKTGRCVRKLNIRPTGRPLSMRRGR